MYTYTNICVYMSIHIHHTYSHTTQMYICILHTYTHIYTTHIHTYMYNTHTHRQHSNTGGGGGSELSLGEPIEKVAGERGEGEAIPENPNKFVCERYELGILCVNLHVFSVFTTLTCVFWCKSVWFLY